MRAPRLAMAAAAVLALEGAAVTVFAIIELFQLGAGEAASLITAIALIVLTLIGAAALFAFAWGTRVGHMWARSGGVVLQLLAIALVLATLTVPPIAWTFVLGVGIPSVVCFVLLLASTRKEAVRPPDSTEDPVAD
ncbi:hypothetical protein [Microbacterium sp. A94]|uniref:hypothetical protein n=1 Tax=Microbacterium sp. A94 TaxID=3450717 RepID=UPI003F43AA1B